MDFLRWTIGDVTITKIVEMEIKAGGLDALLPDATPEALKPISWLHPHFVDDEGHLLMSIHGLVVETPSKRIMVDTCIGNDKKDRILNWSNLQTGFMDDMHAAGFPPESIDIVLCTHLHVDHVGWNTRLVEGQWVPTFPNARYLMADSEFTHWRDQEEDDGSRQVFADSVQPVFEAGLVDLVAPDHKICKEVCLIPTHGHTPGHVSVVIRSKGEEAIITGDFIHHPCQLARVHWSSIADTDPDAAVITRRRVFENYAGKSALMIGTHFPYPTAGTIERDGDGFLLKTNN
ncbi:MAG: MBL fold metallo-hydrolase [Parvularculales bacterium]